MAQKYTQKRWSLGDLYPSHDSPELEKAFTEADQIVSEFEGFREALTDNIDQAAFMQIIKNYDGLVRIAQRLGSFAGLWFTEDTQNQEALSLMARVDQITTRLYNRVLFFELWWKGLDEAVAEKLMAGVGDYRYWLEKLRLFKPHTLSEPEEKIVNIKDVTGVNAFRTLYDAITNRYVYKVEVDGEVKEMTRGELMVYARHHDPDLREEAYKELYKVYGDDGPILGQMYQTIVRDWQSEKVELRNFAEPISARNLYNNIPDEVINTLLDVAEKNSVIFQRFFRLKAKWLGVEKIRRYDVYAPVAKSDKGYGFDEAVQMVLEAFNGFEPRIAEMAQRVFDTDHIDSEVRKGKEGGAFCASIEPEMTPWVKLNYQGKADDVATMAHELGHAIHSMLASDHTMFTFHAPLPLAENASTFGEMLLIDKLLSEEEDADVRRDILFQQVDDAYATIMRQSFFALFEKKAHKMIEDGATVDELAEAYLENLRTQFGDAVELSDEFKWEWVSIPHIYQVPFYVYAYAFGQLLVLSLYKQFKEEGDSFKPKYLQILEAGGSEAPATILERAGIDIASADFWQGGFDVIANLVAELEEIPIK